MLGYFLSRPNHYDARTDTYSIHGVRYSGQLFAAFAAPNETSLYRFKRKGSVCTIEEVTLPMPEADQRQTKLNTARFMLRQQATESLLSKEVNLRLHDGVTHQEIKLFPTPSRITFQCLAEADPIKIRECYLKWLATKLPAEIVSSHVSEVLAVKKPKFSKN
jgi:hypothetical protein